MVVPQLVMFLHVVVMWCSSNTFTLAAPSFTNALRDAKLREFRAETTYPINTTPRNITMELKPIIEETTWLGEEFLSYVKNISAKKCPPKADNKTCADDYASTQAEVEFNKLNSTEQEAIMEFLGGSRDAVTCAQLVRTKVGSEETPENVACVLYFYDRHSNDMTLVTPDYG